MCHNQCVRLIGAAVWRCIAASCSNQQHLWGDTMIAYFHMFFCSIPSHVLGAHALHHSYYHQLYNMCILIVRIVLSGTLYGLRLQYSASFCLFLFPLIHSFIHIFIHYLFTSVVHISKNVIT